MISFSNNDTNNHLQQSSYDNMISFSNNNPLQQSSYDNMAKDIQLDPASDYNQKSYAFGMDPVSLQFTSLTNSYTLQLAKVLVIYLFCLYAWLLSQNYFKIAKSKSICLYIRLQPIIL